MPVRRAFVGLLIITGCGAGPEPEALVRDSAGVRIVENRVPAGPELVVEATAAISIGPDAAGGVEFISPISAVRLDDGRIVAAGWAMTELQLFDSTGQWLRTLGRQGSGPAEFEALGLVYPDSLGGVIVFEPGSQRVHRWSSAMEFLQLSLLTSPEARPTAWVSGAFSDGTLLLATRTPHAAGSSEFLEQGTRSLFRGHESGGTWDSLISFPDRPSVRSPRDPRWSAGTPLFTAGPSFALRGRRIAFTTGDRFEVQIRDARGTLRQVVRKEASERVISAAEFSRVLSATVAAIQEDRRSAMESRLRETSKSRIRPAVSGVWLDPDGRVWATFGDSALGERPTASVFDSLGKWEADAELPAGFRILQVDRDGLLGMVRDPDGFYQLRFHRLRWSIPA